MATNVTLNGSTYSIPAEGDSSWGTNVSNYLIAISTSVLQKTGGVFTLTAETDFGATFGLKSPYIKSQAANPASSGIFRLGNAETISWRNAANNGDLSITVNASDAFQFNGSSPVFSGSIVNADINAAAAIAYSKLAALSLSSLLVSDGSGFISASSVTSTEAGYLSGVTSAIQTQINTKAPSASPTFTGTVTTPLTASRAVVTGASSELAAATTTATEIGYVNGVTSAIQTQLDEKQARSVLTTKGDLYVATASATVARQGVGVDGTFLRADSSQTNGVTWASVAGSAFAVTTKTTTYTATTSDDIILASTSGGTWTLTLYTAVGNSGKVLTIKKTTSDFTALTIDGNGSETIDGSTTTSLNTINEVLRIVSDGTNWQILERKFDSTINIYTPTSSGTNSGSWARVRDGLEITQYYALSGSPSGGIPVEIPSGLTINSSSLVGGNAVLGTAWCVTAASNQRWAGIVVYNNTTEAVILGPSSSGGWGAGIPAAFQNGDAIYTRMWVPITGWKAN